VRTASAVTLHGNFSGAGSFASVETDSATPRAAAIGGSDSGKTTNSTREFEICSARNGKYVCIYTCLNILKRKIFITVLYIFNVDNNQIEKMILFVKHKSVSI
jgi:hypothetical protein